MMPTVLLSDFDRVAVDEALQTEPAIDASLVADALEMIDVLDALSAESLNIDDIDPDVLSLLVDADLATSSAWLCTALSAAMDARMSKCARPGGAREHHSDEHASRRETLDDGRRS